MSLNLKPYLNFNGNAREALEFYNSIFGGKLDISTFGQIMSTEDAEMDKQVMHGELVSDMVSFYASDGRPGEKVQFGDNMYMALMGTDKEKLVGYFNKLYEGGKVGTALAPQPWGDEYGDLVDKFGVRWLVNISKE